MPPSRLIPGGFTLVEILVVIAVIGVLAAVGIQSLGNFNERARVAQAKSQARLFAELYQTARASGAEVPGTTLPEIFNSMSDGVHGGGQFSTSVFQLSLTAETKTRISRYLEWGDNGVVYVCSED